MKDYEIWGTILALALVGWLLVVLAPENRVWLNPTPKELASRLDAPSGTATPQPSFSSIDIDTERDVLLELLEPVQTDASLPVVSSDGAMKVAFAVAKHKTIDYERSNPSEGVWSRIDVVSSEIHLELTNLTSGVVVVVWDLCSMELPDGKTTNVMHSGQRYITRLEPTRPTSIAPGGSLTDVLTPTSGVYYSEFGGWKVAERILEGGPFGLTLAIEVSGEVRYYSFKFRVVYSVVEETTRPAQVGGMAPDFTVNILAGGQASLSDYRGKVVILDFWASWSAPCKSAMPVLNRLANRYKDRGLVLIELSVDRNPGEARRFLADNGYTDLVALWESPAAAPTAAHTLYRISGVPHTFVIDRDGIVRFAGHPASLSDALLEPWL